MKKSNTPIKFLLAIVFMGYIYIFPALSQNLGGEPDETSYYIELKTGESTKVHEVATNVLSIRYFDRYGENDQLDIFIYNWKREEIARYLLSKSFGLNYYNIKFEIPDASQSYFLETSDEKGVRYTLTFKKRIEKPELPEVEIVVNPITLNCEPLSPNLVEFYADISGGRSPYQVQWFILDGNMKTLLYQPLSARLEESGKSMAVQVDKPPSYLVLLQVQDACGNLAKRAVSINCGEEKKVYHSVFIDPVFTPEKKEVER